MEATSTQACAPQTKLEIFSTAPVCAGMEPDAYLRKLCGIARSSEDAGCMGILVYTDNSQLDPWLVSQVIIQNTKRLCPLVAVQPAYSHPFTVAKTVASLGYLHGRRIYLNMVAGGFKNDLTALNDATPHDLRYERLVEYTTIIRNLLSGPEPVTFEGRFYQVRNLFMKPPALPDLFPGMFVSGSSEAGLSAARAMCATAIEYPQPPDHYSDAPSSGGENRGVRVGIIARGTSDEAWSVAHQRFPEDRRGQLAHDVAMKFSDSVWHKQLSQVVVAPKEKPAPYWLLPFQTYKTFCPYLVGSHDEVACELAKYVAAGYRTYILDIPATEEEFAHINRVFGLASETSFNLAA